MQTVIVPIGDGRLVEYTEGALRVPPLPPKVPYKVTTKRAKKPRGRPPGKIVNGHRMKYRKKEKRPAPSKTIQQSLDETPGLREWGTLRGKQVTALNPEPGRKIGQASSITSFRAEKLWDQARKSARKSMEDIKKTIDLPAAAEEALLAALTTMRSPLAAREKLAAAKLVLDFTMAKPVAKSEVTVNAAEAWLAGLNAK